MVKVRIVTEHGDLILVERAKSVVYIRTCPYRQHEFETENRKQIYCCESHRVMYTKQITPTRSSF